MAAAGSGTTEKVSTVKAGKANVPKAAVPVDVNRKPFTDCGVAKGANTFPVIVASGTF